MPSSPPLPVIERTPLRILAETLDGDLRLDTPTLRAYATDASAYQEMPTAVAIPRSEADIQRLIRFAAEQRIGLIPRTAGTSLAGQCVGDGIVVDVSKHFTRIVDIDADRGRVTVQPGVIRNELNDALRPHGWMFGPETSTQNRAMIGGMLGNNSCGSNSIRYGSVRDHVVSVTGYLSDGSRVTFDDADAATFAERCTGDSLGASMHRQARDRLSDADVRDEIRREFPRPSIRRRNHGYAVDELMNASPLDATSTRPFNFARLIAGSEGTLMFVTEITLSLVPLPPPVSALQCVHFDNVDDALRATVIAVRRPDVHACELIDDVILRCTERSIEHRRNRFFIVGEPAAILITEIRGETEADVRAAHAETESTLRAGGLGYAYPVLFGDDGRRVFDLRKAGLGLLGNMPGDEKAAPVIEDTAVAVADLPNYIAEFNRILDDRFGVRCVHYAHAGDGELHLRPVVNLKTVAGRRTFRGVAESVAALVKRYGGSLSGEHGDGRLRGEFLPLMIGEKNYRLLREIKQVWDPAGIFNPGKIIDAPPMDRFLRYDDSDPNPRNVPSVFDWSRTGGLLRAAEMCNGSGDCRKTPRTGGVMCPSYMATRDEVDTTRARANVVRQVLTDAPEDAAGPLAHPDVDAVMARCLSCKGCKTECPSTVDLGRIKAEYLQHHHDVRGVTLRTRAVGHYATLSRLAAASGPLSRWRVVKRLTGSVMGIDPRRAVPEMPRVTFDRWWRRRRRKRARRATGSPVLLHVDEFSRYADSHVAIAAVKLMDRLGFDVRLAPIVDSGRTRISQGLLRAARSTARRNVRAVGPIVSDSVPLVGLEPSAVITFRDEYPDLVGDDLRETARRTAPHCLTFEEWFAGRIDAGEINRDAFTDDIANVVIHGHCFQKALSDVDLTRRCLSFPPNYTARVIPSGCCGMAGAFGFDPQHYDLSMKIGELTLLPAVRRSPKNTILVAAGTSCRQQIADGTGRRAIHPAEALFDALKTSFDPARSVPDRRQATV